MLEDSKKMDYELIDNMCFHDSEEPKKDEKRNSIHYNIYTYNISANEQLAHNLIMCSKENMNSYNWTDYVNGMPYFFYKAIKGDIESLILIMEMYAKNLFTMYDKDNLNVLNYLAKLKNNELLTFINLVKEKFGINTFFSYCRSTYTLISDFIKSGNSNIYDLYLNLSNENINETTFIYIHLHNMSDDEIIKFINHSESMKNYIIKNCTQSLIENNKVKSLKMLNIDVNTLKE